MKRFWWFVALVAFFAVVDADRTVQAQSTKVVANQSRPITIAQVYIAFHPTNGIETKRHGLDASDYMYVDPSLPTPPAYTNTPYATGGNNETAIYGSGITIISLGAKGKKETGFDEVEFGRPGYDRKPSAMATPCWNVNANIKRYGNDNNRHFKPVLLGDKYYIVSKDHRIFISFPSTSMCASPPPS